MPSVKRLRWQRQCPCRVTIRVVCRGIEAPGPGRPTGPLAGYRLAARLSAFGSGLVAYDDDEVVWTATSECRITFPLDADMPFNIMPRVTGSFQPKAVSDFLVY